MPMYRVTYLTKDIRLRIFIEEQDVFMAIDYAEAQAEKLGWKLLEVEEWR